MGDRRTRKQSSMPQTRTVSEQDRSLFRDAIGQTRPVIDDRVQHNRPKANARPRQPDASERLPLAAPDSAGDLMTIAAGEELRYLRSGIQQRVLKQLGRRLAIDAELDLHQMTVETARSNIDDFIHECQLLGITRIKIIHGKGLRSDPDSPVLKNLTNANLRQNADVLAFVSAPAHDGGAGAVYVLLKID